MSAFYTTQASRRSAQVARNNARKLAAKIGVTLTLETEGGWHEVTITAPDGKRFEPQLHELVVANACATTDGLWERVVEDLNGLGGVLEDCNDPDCEWCHS